MAKGRQILFICRDSPARFKAQDFEILSERYDVEWIKFKYTPGCILRIFFAMRTCPLAFCWFAGPWAFLSVLAARCWGKKCAIVTGGWDVANCPDIGYGIPQSIFLRPFGRFALRHADAVFPISKWGEIELLAFVKPIYHRMIHCCVDCPDESPPAQKKRQVLTVGAVYRKSSLRKGHFEFVEVARHLPDVKFILVGKQQDETINELKAKAGDNVEFLDYIETSDLLKLFVESKVYLQLSRHEGFGIAVAESMWYGGTPVVSSNGSLPEIVGEGGVIMVNLEPAGVAKKIREVLDSYPDVNEKAMAQARTFPVDKRRRALFEEVDKLLGKE